MATVQVAGEQRLLLPHISWQTYEALLKDLDSPGIRLTYDHGSLEIMTLSHGHEQFSRLIGRLIDMLTLELNIPIHGGKSTTFKQEAKKRGLEPDECYWIQSEPAMRGKKEFDIDVDPPPDLALEVDITSSSLDRMAIYAALGVKEVWRFDGETLSVHRLRTDGAYVAHSRSASLPDLPPADVVRFLRLSDAQDETSLMRLFVAWVREHVRPVYETRQAESAVGKKRRPKK